MEIELKNNKVITNKELLNKLYNKELRLEFNLKCNGYNKLISANVDLGHNENPDCCIGNFYHNFYFRTPYGMKEKKYTSLGSLINAIKRVLKTNGIEVDSINILKFWSFEVVGKINN